jgi:hypothetical protein
MKKKKINRMISDINFFTNFTLFFYTFYHITVQDNMMILQIHFLTLYHHLNYAQLALCENTGLFLDFEFHTSPFIASATQHLIRRGPKSEDGKPRVWPGVHPPLYITNSGG